MCELKTPKGFIMIRNETHSIFIKLDHIASIAVRCRDNAFENTVYITTIDGTDYKAICNLEDFLNLIDAAS